MDFIKLEKDIIDSVTNAIQHIKDQDYWDDINSFCLYTDESLMSLSLLFNTNTHFQSVKNDEYPLTYKYSPAEWFSETISEDDVAYLYKNIAFSSVSSQMMAFSMSDEFEEDEDRDDVIKACLSAIRHCIDENIFQKPKSIIYLFIYLFMMSDGYDEREVLTWNKSLNEPSLKKELTEWV
ncbi:DUF4303 domain-containing protein [Xenorhabdus bovienii]|uniref:DUF4303 domain-containing protein n=1 Tax=Xenorhabdus bovienii TaxID=40576 RepID=UPI0023B22EDC|nr:DUF4303 domain-containing protein [Xenorhabdus bovienii]MDE9463409.1 DUF4303 domain-containing protein [Xenorhabdus bovienii]MDE9471196.1 DUF4303 domain-containing protein [Xenorhabdus bovienii]